VAKKHLDYANIHLLFEQVRRETVSQGVRSYALVDLRGLGGGVNGTVQLPRWPWWKLCATCCNAFRRAC
jgi:hypothetical protein